MWSQNVLQLDMSFLPHRLWLNDGERVPPGAVEPAAISRKMVANRRSKSKRVMGTAGSRVASRASGVEMRRLGAGTAAGEQIVAA